MEVLAVIEEAESGSFADGSTYLILSVHKSEKGAEKAVEAWRREHVERGHEYDPEEGWCSCGSGVTTDSVELGD